MLRGVVVATGEVNQGESTRSRPTLRRGRGPWVGGRAQRVRAPVDERGAPGGSAGRELLGWRLVRVGVGLDPGERAARAAAYFPGWSWSCPRRSV